jgi:hypothetical protein
MWVSVQREACTTNQGIPNVEQDLIAGLYLHMLGKPCYKVLLGLLPKLYALQPRSFSKFS